MELWYSLVNLLPFEWAEPGSMYFMKNALLSYPVCEIHTGARQESGSLSRMYYYTNSLTGDVTYAFYQ